MDVLVVQPCLGEVNKNARLCLVYLGKANKLKALDKLAMLPK